MALVKAYELKNGLTAPNASHIITKVDTVKRPSDDIDPAGARPENAPDYAWKAGWYGRIAVAIYLDKAARDAGKPPIAAISVNPTDAPSLFEGERSTDQNLNFTINVTSSDSILDQAYAHLKTLSKWQGATEA
jgi:hypothetical protein